MPMPSYPIFCYTKDCKNLALYKIASRWSDGVVHELKTYTLCCADCLPKWFQASCQKQAACRLTAGESLDRPGIYSLQKGQRDLKLARLPEMEKQLGELPVG